MLTSFFTTIGGVHGKAGGGGGWRCLRCHRSSCRIIWRRRRRCFLLYRRSQVGFQPKYQLVQVSLSAPQYHHTNPMDDYVYFLVWFLFTRVAFGSRIRYLFDPWIRDLGWVKIRDEQPGSFFRELRNNFLGWNTYILWCRSGIQDPGSGMEKIRIQDQWSGINIPDPQHCFLLQFVKEYNALPWSKYCIFCRMTRVFNTKKGPVKVFNGLTRTMNALLQHHTYPLVDHVYIFTSIY